MMDGEMKLVQYEVSRIQAQEYFEDVGKKCESRDLDVTDQTLGKSYLCVTALLALDRTSRLHN